MRLISYNIHKGIGGRDRRYDLERVLRVVAHEHPDLICLQEVAIGVPRAGSDDQAARLTESFPGFTPLYQTNHRFRRGSYGNLVLTRWPHASAHQIHLHYQNHKLRGAQLIVVDTPQGPLHLVNWHLGLAERTRRWQAAHLLDHHHFRDAAHLPTLVTGDFNDWRNTLAGGPFARHGLKQVTEPLFRFRSFPAYLAMGAIDKAFCCRQVEVVHARVVRTVLAKAASDHLPLVLDLKLKPQVIRAYSA
jgi:endonuclease/exonuclease/phosphatase family metal-dependent hydrolase